MEVTITTENFESLKNGNLPLVVDFWATWCGPCRMIAPYIAQLGEENDAIAMEYGIRNIPPVLFIKDGKVVDKHVGAATKAKLQEKFEKLL